MHFKISKTIYRAFSVVIVSACAMLVFGQINDVRADEDHDSQMRTVTNAKWLGECSGCHVAYSPGFLPAESWRAIMTGLDKHFGSNASMDAESVKEISTFLEKNADNRKKSHEASGKPFLRITETHWFKSEHREVAAHTWKNPKVKSAANCGACHTKAESGVFSERSLKVPK